MYSCSYLEQDGTSVHHDGRCSLVLIYTDDGRCSHCSYSTKDDGRCSLL